MVKLNLGSGDCPLDEREWINMDAKNHASLFPLYRREYSVNESSDFHGAIADNCADEVRASHVLEHFSYAETFDVLKEWVRVLKPGGWLKIAVPDFEWIIDVWSGKRTRPNNVTSETLQAYLFGGQVDENDFHKASFTDAKLRSLLSGCGLVNIQRWTSEIQDCAALPVSLNLMGQKPEPLLEVADPAIDGCAFKGWVFDGKPVTRREYEALTCAQPQVKEQTPEAKIDPFGSLLGVDNRTAMGKIIADRVKPSTSRTQVFAAGRWQDLYDGANIDVADEDELAAANAGQLQTRTIVSDGKRAVRIALCLSTPRQGFLRPFERLLALAHQASISVFSGDGVFWHHALSRSIRNAVEFDFEDGSDGFDFILTADYDTYAMVEDIKALAELLARSPEADCIAPMQMKRGGTGEILAGGRNMNLTQALVPIETGHFGLTIFRKSFFERMPKPWFYEKPDAEGHWGEGRIDADIGFWLNAKKAKLNVMLAPGIVAGHGEELITYPRIVNGKPEKVYQAVNDWLNLRTKPEGIGVQ